MFNLITTKETAAILGVSQRRVRAMIAEKKLKSTKVYNFHMLNKHGIYKLANKFQQKEKTKTNSQDHRSIIIRN